jgi:hypothetical protein
MLICSQSYFQFPIYCPSKYCASGAETQLGHHVDIGELFNEIFPKLKILPTYYSKAIGK